MINIKVNQKRSIVRDDTTQAKKATYITLNGERIAVKDSRIKSVPIINGVCKESDREQIRPMLLKVYELSSVNQKLFIKPIMDRFFENGHITPAQLSHISHLYVKLVK